WASVADVSADGNQLVLYEWGTAQAGKQIAHLRDIVMGSSLRLGEGRPLALSPDEQWVLAARSPSNPELVLLPVKPGSERRPPGPGVAAFLEGAWIDKDKFVFT